MKSRFAINNEIIDSDDGFVRFHFSAHTSPANKNQAGNQKIFQAKRAQQSRDSKIRVSEFSEEGCYAASGLAAKYAARCSSGVMSTKGRSSRRTA